MQHSVIAAIRFVRKIWLAIVTKEASLAVVAVDDGEEKAENKDNISQDIPQDIQETNLFAAGAYLDSQGRYKMLEPLPTFF